jgi:hypothetical protein
VSTSPFLLGTVVAARVTARVTARVRAPLALLAIAAAASGCGSSSAARGGYRQPTPAPVAAAPGDGDSPVNIIDPVGPFFEHRQAYALTDSQVTKLEAIDSRYLVTVRPLRRTLDSLRTVSRDWPGYVAGGASVDTAHLPAPARDSVLRLRDATAGAAAELRVRARRTRIEALDVLSLEQLVRVAMYSTSQAPMMRPMNGRRGGGAPPAGTSTNPNTPTTAATVISPYARIRDPLQGIALSDSERTTVDSIKSSYRAEARDLGDPVPATAAPLRDIIRRQYDAIRAVLTPDQQAIFDHNRTSAPAPTPTPTPAATRDGHPTT